MAFESTFDKICTVLFILSFWALVSDTYPANNSPKTDPDLTFQESESKIICVNGVFNGESGRCACDPYYVGKRCELPKCFHGVRHKQSEICICDPGWSGIHCESCLSKASEKPQPQNYESDSEGTNKEDTSLSVALWIVLLSSFFLFMTALSIAIVSWFTCGKTTQVYDISRLGAQIQQQIIIDEDSTTSNVDDFPRIFTTFDHENFTIPGFCQQPDSARYNSNNYSMPPPSYDVIVKTVSPPPSYSEVTKQSTPATASRRHSSSSAPAQPPTT